MKTRKEKLEEAIKSKKVVDEQSMRVFMLVSDLEERLDRELPNLQNVLEQVKGKDGHTYRLGRNK